MKGAIWVVMGLVFTCVGLLAGWYARPKEAAHAVHKDHDKHEDHKDHGPKLSPQAIKNIGVEFGEATTRTFVRSQGVPARVADAPDAFVPVVSQVGGRVLEVSVVAGQSVAGDEVVATILRDPLPLPSLALTEEIFRPANESFHEAVADVRKAATSVDLAKTELKRLEGFAESGLQDGLPVIPRKNLIEIQYELRRAERELANAHSELRKHGLTDEQIAAIEEGKPAPAAGKRVWRQALELNGLWSAEAAALYDALPADYRDTPWSMAALAELAAAGRISPGLAEWLKEDPGASTYMLAIAALLQQGSSLEHVRALHAQGGFEPIVSVRAPAGDALDVHEMLVRPGDRVEAGARLAILHDARRVRVLAEAAGGDASALLAALLAGTKLEALPLVPGTGPDLKGLNVAFVRNDESDRGTVAYLPAANEELATREEGKRSFRSWKLRAGLRYVLRLPLESMKDVIVVPAEAVVDEGTDRVIYVEDGDNFKVAKVVVLYQDRNEAVIDPKKSEIFDGDRYVKKGAFALGLALKAAEAGAASDPHAGHQH